MQHLAWCEHVLPSFVKHQKCMKHRRKRYSVEAAFTSPLKCAYNTIFFMFLFVISNFFHLAVILDCHHP